MIKVNWSTVVKVLKFVATVITTVLGTIAGMRPNLGPKISTSSV